MVPRNHDNIWSHIVHAIWHITEECVYLRRGKLQNMSINLPVHIVWRPVLILLAQERLSLFLNHVLFYCIPCLFGKKMPDDCLTKMTCHLVADFKVQVNVHFHLYHIMNCHVQFWWLPEIGVWGLTYYECQRDDGMHVWIMYIVNTCSLLIIFICVNVNVINICTKHNTETFINTCNQWWSCFLLLLWSERANVWSYLVSVNLSQISVNTFF